MRGFWAGTFALIVLYAVVQPNAANSADAASNWFAQAMRRLISGDVAGLPLIAKVAIPGAPPPGGRDPGSQLVTPVPGFGGGTTPTTPGTPVPGI